MTIEGRGYSPYSTLTPAELLLLLGRILQQTVGRIGHNRMNGCWRVRAKPVKAIGFIERASTVLQRRLERGDFQFPVVAPIASAKSISSMSRAFEFATSIQPQI